MAGLAYVSHRQRLVVFWSTKCASTAVVDWFARLEGIPPADDRRHWLYEHGYRYDYLQARHLCEDCGYRSIHFTRNPYHRAVSTFLNKFVVYYGRGITSFDGLELFSRKFIQEFNETRGLKRNTFTGLSFAGYLDHVDRLMSSSRILNLHWDTQLPRDTSCRIRPDYIVRQEKFQDDLRKACRGLDLSDYIPGKHNTTSFPEHFTASPFDESETNSLFLLSSGISISHANLLNEKTAEKIHRLYEEDFNFFGYSKKIDLCHYPPRKVSEKKSKGWFGKIFSLDP